MKVQEFLLFVISFSLVGVLLWYVLTIAEVVYAKEFAVFFFILCLTALLVHSLHGKGIIQDFDVYSSSNRKYSRLRIRPGDYSRKQFGKVVYSRDTINRKAKTKESAPPIYSRRTYRR